MTNLSHESMDRDPNSEVLKKRLNILHYGISNIIIDKACENFGWTCDQSMQVRTEYLRFLYLREVTQEKLWIPEKVMGFWRIHRKIGHDYRTRFAILFDNKTPRRLERPVRNIEEVYEYTIAAYYKCFNEHPPLEVWSISAGLSEQESENRKQVNHYRYFTFALGLLLALKTANQSNNVIAVVFIGLFIIYLSLVRL